MLETCPLLIGSRVFVGFHPYTRMPNRRHTHTHTHIDVCMYCQLAAVVGSHKLTISIFRLGSTGLGFIYVMPLHSLSNNFILFFSSEYARSVKLSGSSSSRNNSDSYRYIRGGGETRRDQRSNNIKHAQSVDHGSGNCVSGWWRADTATNGSRNAHNIFQ